MIGRLTTLACLAVVAPRAAYADAADNSAPAATQATAAGTGNAASAAITGPLERWHAGVALGVYVPRADLDAGVLVGAFGAFAVDERGVWRVHLGADWVRSGRDGPSLLSPGPFPRSRAELDERTDLLTIAAGASARLATVGDIEVRLRMSAGLQVARARFEAYAMSQVESGIGPAGMIDVSAAGRAGALGWQAIVGWREARRDLGGAAAYGDEVTSGAVVAVGACW